MSVCTSEVEFKDSKFSALTFVKEQHYEVWDNFNVRFCIYRPFVKTTYRVRLRKDKNDNRKLRGRQIVVCETEDRDTYRKRTSGPVRPSMKHAKCLLPLPAIYSSSPFSSFFASSHFSILSVYAGLQNADLIRDNLTPSTRSCFDELNLCRLGVSTPCILPRSLFSKLRHRRIFRP